MRLNRKLSLSDMSVDSGIDKDLISKLELGKRPAVSLYTAVKMAHFFECSIEDLLK
jgi:DNA-binding Xre family transcriptional regulator